VSCIQEKWPGPHTWQTQLHPVNELSDLVTVVEHFAFRVQTRHFLIDDGDANGIVTAGNVP